MGKKRIFGVLILLIVMLLVLTLKSNQNILISDGLFIGLILGLILVSENITTAIRSFFYLIILEITSLLLLLILVSMIFNSPIPTTNVVISSDKAVAIFTLAYVILTFLIFYNQNEIMVSNEKPKVALAYPQRQRASQGDTGDLVFYNYGEYSVVKIKLTAIVLPKEKFLNTILYFRASATICALAMEVLGKDWLYNAIILPQEETPAKLSQYLNLHYPALTTGKMYNFYLTFKSLSDRGRVETHVIHSLNFIKEDPNRYKFWLLTNTEHISLFELIRREINNRFFKKKI